MVGLACPHKSARPLWIHTELTTFGGGYMRKWVRSFLQSHSALLAFQGGQRGKACGGVCRLQDHPPRFSLTLIFLSSNLQRRTLLVGVWSGFLSLPNQLRQAGRGGDLLLPPPKGCDWEGSMSHPSSAVRTQPQGLTPYPS